MEPNEEITECGVWETVYTIEREVWSKYGSVKQNIGWWNEGSE